MSCCGGRGDEGKARMRLKAKSEPRVQRSDCLPRTGVVGVQAPGSQTPRQRLQRTGLGSPPTPSQPPAMPARQFVILEAKIGSLRFAAGVPQPRVELWLETRNSHGGRRADLK